MVTHKRLSKHCHSFFITSDLHTHVGTTSAIVFTDTEPRYTSLYSKSSLETLLAWRSRLLLLEVHDKVRVADVGLLPLEFALVIGVGHG